MRYDALYYFVNRRIAIVWQEKANAGNEKNPYYDT